MNNIDLEIFLTIIQAKSISGAANVLFLSPSAVGARLKALEEELGFSLFLRKKGYKTIQLTEKGRSFIPYAEQWLSLWEKSRTLKDAPDSQKFALGTSSSLLNFCTGIYQEFIALHPTLQLSVSILDSDIAYTLVQQNKLDMALIMHASRVSGVITEELFKERLVISYSASYHVQSGKPVSIHSLPLEHQILFIWNNGFDEWYNQHVPYYSGGILRVNSASILTELFDPQVSWAIVPLSVAESLYETKRIPFCPLLENPPSRSVYQIINATNKNQPLTQNFAAMLTAYSEKFLQHSCFTFN